MIETIETLWSKRNPKFEQSLNEVIFKAFTDYGKGTNQYTDAKGKYFGAGYEVYIYAYFLGLYINRRRILCNSTKDLGFAIQNWKGTDSGSSNSIFRKGYPDMRRYIFVSLIAKTDTIDWVALEKGQITPRQVVDQLIQTMEEYANYGFYIMLDKMQSDPGYFNNNRRFLNCIIEVVNKTNDSEGNNEIEQLEEQL